MGLVLKIGLKSVERESEIFCPSCERPPHMSAPRADRLNFSDQPGPGEMDQKTRQCVPRIYVERRNGDPFGRARAPETYQMYVLYTQT